MSSILSQRVSVAARLKFPLHIYPVAEFVAYPRRLDQSSIYYCSRALEILTRSQPIHFSPNTHHVRIVALSCSLPSPRHRSRRLLTLLQIRRGRKRHPRRRDGQRCRTTRCHQQLASHPNRPSQRRHRCPVPRLPRCLHDRYIGAAPNVGDCHPLIAPGSRDELSESGSESRPPGYRAHRQPIQRRPVRISCRSSNAHNNSNTLFIEQHGRIDLRADPRDR